MGHPCFSFLPLSLLRDLYRFPHLQISARTHPLVQIFTQRNRVPNIISRIFRATDLQILSGNLFRRFPCSYPWFPAVPCGYPWLSLVIPGYTWLYLVIPGYTWLYLVIPGYLQFKYLWNRLRICNYSFRHLQKSSVVTAR